MTEVRFKFITENRKNDLSALKNRGGGVLDKKNKRKNFLKKINIH